MTAEITINRLVRQAVPLPCHLKKKRKKKKEERRGTFIVDYVEQVLREISDRSHKSIHFKVKTAPNRRSTVV